MKTNYHCTHVSSVLRMMDLVYDRHEVHHRTYNKNIRTHSDIRCSDRIRLARARRPPLVRARVVCSLQAKAGIEFLGYEHTNAL